MKVKLLGVDYSNGTDRTCKVYGYVKKGVAYITKVELIPLGEENPY